MDIQGACTPVPPARSHISKWKESKFLTNGHDGGHRNATQANGCASSQPIRQNLLSFHFEIWLRAGCTGVHAPCISTLCPLYSPSISPLFPLYGGDWWGVVGTGGEAPPEASRLAAGHPVQCYGGSGGCTRCTLVHPPLPNIIIYKALTGRCGCTGCTE